MKMKLPLLCRNTRAATEMAVKLTRLSKVELFCARNWGKPQIKHLIREARVELSRQAVSIDGVNWVMIPFRKMRFRSSRFQALCVTLIST